MKKLTKYLITAGIACMIAVGATWWILDKKYENDLAEITDTYDAELAAISAERDSVQMAFDSVTVLLTSYEAELETLNKKDKEHKAKIDHLEDELKKALNWVFDGLIDDNYKYLQERYPRVDTLDYLFAGNQVKSMALDIIAGDYKDSIIDEQFELEQTLRAKLLTSSVMVSTLYRERNEFEYLTAKLYEQLAIKTKEGKLSAEEIAKLKKALNKWRVGGLSVGACALLLLILL